MRYKSSDTNWVLFLWQGKENSQELKAYENGIEYNDGDNIEAYKISSKIVKIDGDTVERFEVIEPQEQLTYLSIELNSNTDVSITTTVGCSVKVDSLKKYIKAVI